MSELKGFQIQFLIVIISEVPDKNREPFNTYYNYQVFHH